MHRPSWDYRDISQLTQAFADTEKDGVWGIAAEIAGSLNAGGDATAATVSCATSGNCTVGGVFQDNANRHQPFVLTETAGSWGQAGPVSGSTAFTSSTETSIAALSCASAGNSVAGGSYSSGVSDDQAYVLTQTHGAWGKAALLPGLASLNQGGDAHRSPRSPAARPATARSAVLTGTRPARSAPSSRTRRTAPGPRRSRCLASRPSPQPAA
jgi:hypothetical protein